MATHMEIGVRLSALAVSVEPGEKAAHESQSIFCYSGLIPSNTREDCVATSPLICLFSGIRSSLLCSDHKVRGDTNLCWRYACFSPTSEGSATSSPSKHWSGDCRVYQTCSPALLETVKETGVPLKLFNVQSSNFKSLRKSGAAQATPAVPLPTRGKLPSHLLSDYPVDPTCKTT